MKSLTYNDPKDMKAPAFNVALFGTFDVDNFGDCLFPLIVEHHLAKRLGKIQLYPFSPSNRLARIANYSRVYAFHELTQIFSEPPSCFIIGGGELIRTGYNTSVYPSLGPLLYPFSLKTWLLPIMVASAWNCPTILNAVGMDTIFDEDFKELSRTYLQKLDLCFVRDPFTAEKLSMMQVGSEVLPDSAFSVPSLLTSSEWANHYDQIAKEFSLPEKFLIVQGSLYPTHSEFTNAVGRAALNVGLPVVLLPICYYASDIVSLKLMQKTLTKLGVKTYLIDRFLDTIQTSSVLSKSELYIGTSLHGAIVSLSFGKPALSFSPRVKGKHKGVLLVVDLQNCHVSDANKIPGKVEQLLRMPKNLLAKKIELANVRINGYFDRISDIIRGNRCSSVPKNWSQDLATGEIRYGSMDDFQKLTQLCLVKKKELNSLKRFVHCLVRQNYSIGACYDRLMFWLREHGVLSYS